MKRIIIISAIVLTQCKPPLQPKPLTYVEYECECSGTSVVFEFEEGDTEAIQETGSSCIDNGCNWKQL